MTASERIRKARSLRETRAWTVAVSFDVDATSAEEAENIIRREIDTHMTARYLLPFDTFDEDGFPCHGGVRVG